VAWPHLVVDVGQGPDQGMGMRAVPGGAWPPQPGRRADLLRAAGRSGGRGDPTVRIPDGSGGSGDPLGTAAELGGIGDGCLVVRMMLSLTIWAGSCLAASGAADPRPTWGYLLLRPASRGCYSLNFNHIVSFHDKSCWYGTAGARQRPRGRGRGRAPGPRCRPRSPG
jgi:hypothetical protein